MGDLLHLARRAREVGPALRDATERYNEELRRCERALAERFGRARIQSVPFGPGRLLLLADGRLWVVAGGQRLPLASASRKTRCDAAPFLVTLAAACERAAAPRP